MGSRVMVVDDSALVREELSAMLGHQNGLQVVGTAAHGVAALELADALKPDLVTLDVQMPVMDGLTTLKHLMTRRPVATVMVSAFTREDSHVTFDCLRYGAIDFIEKPGGEQSVTLGHTKQVLVERLQRASEVELPAPTYFRARPRPAREPVSGPAPASSIVLVTGGRSGLGPTLELLASVPRDLGGALITCLDSHPLIVESLAAYLARFAALSVTTVLEGEVPLHAGTAYLLPAYAPFMVLEDGPRPVLRAFSAPAGASLPSLTQALFTSAGQTFGRAATAVVLSGSPAGTAEGVEHLLTEGGRSLLQAPDTALEPQMLDLVVRRGLAGMVGDVRSLLDTLLPEAGRRA